MTLVVNLYGGPGSGKSTTAAGLFYDLKRENVNVEIAHEFAKDLVWDKSDTMHFECQPRLAGEQIWRIQRLIGQVDVVIVDSPILFCALYPGNHSRISESFVRFLLDQDGSWDTLNIFIDRANHKYNPVGRNQTEEEARRIDDRIVSFLDQWNIPYEPVEFDFARIDTLRLIRKALA